MSVPHINRKNLKDLSTITTGTIWLADCSEPCTQENFLVLIPEIAVHRSSFNSIGAVTP